LLGDSTFKPPNVMVSCFKKPAGNRLGNDKAYFNTKACENLQVRALHWSDRDKISGLKKMIRVLIKNMDSFQRSNRMIVAAAVLLQRMSLW